MKIIVIIALTFFLFLSCSKNESIINDTFKGKWIDTLNNSDILIFEGDAILKRNKITRDAESQTHFYRYSIRADVLELEYIGPDKVYFIEPFHCSFLFKSDNNLLQINNLNTVYPVSFYEGNIFKRISKFQ